MDFVSETNGIIEYEWFLEVSRDGHSFFSYCQQETKGSLKAMYLLHSVKLEGGIEFISGLLAKLTWARN